ncbi:MAG: GAF domain-containing protein [Rubrivivax sp.]|nr:GAF domain-containing protein [Rubrivivax sp.]
MSERAVSLDELRPCLEGVIPATVATCDAHGMPNATFVSQMQYVDAGHVALSFQFFNKTRENILANPQATAILIDPVTAASYRLSLLYLRTETAGPLFQAMKAKLAGIASHTGMAGVFQLRGADVYAVAGVQRLRGDQRPRAPRRHPLLRALRQCSERLGGCTDLGQLFDQAMTLLGQAFGIGHALLLMADLPARRLYTVASRGYGATGVGSEIAFGDGVIGVAAEQRVPIRINHMTVEYRYGTAAREGAAGAAPLETAIPFPGLSEPHSQLAVPVTAAGRLLGVLCVESEADLAFDYDDEEALLTLASLLAARIAVLPLSSEGGDAGEAAAAGTPPPAAPAAPGATTAPSAPAPLPGPALEVRHYRAHHTVFVGSEYLIKGVAGAILWKLLQLHSASGRADFSNRELRAMTDLGLPDLNDNLEARLVLLQRRLAERCPAIALERTGRGQLRLVLGARLQLADVDG